MSFQKWKKKKENALDEGKLDQVFAACLELAEHYTHKEEFENALQEYKEAKRAAKASNDTINVALCHRMVGQVYCSMQNYDLAVKYQLKYLELARSTNDPVEEQRALANLGHMYFLKGETYANPESQEKNENLAKAKKYCSMSLQVCESEPENNLKMETQSILRSLLEGSMNRLKRQPEALSTLSIMTMLNNIEHGRYCVDSATNRYAKAFMDANQITTTQIGGWATVADPLNNNSLQKVRILCEHCCKKQRDPTRFLQ